MKNLAIFLTFFFLASCKPKEVILNNNERIDRVQRLVPVILPIETASAKAILECSAEGAVLLARLNVESSRNARLTFLLDSLGNLSVDAIVDPDTIYIPSDSVFINKDVVRTTVEYKEKELTLWQKVKQEAGGLTIGLCVAAIIFVVIRLFKK
jgi:hypothetical protein